jgi:hypothetical protein
MTNPTDDTNQTNDDQQVTSRNKRNVIDFLTSFITQWDDQHPDNPFLQPGDDDDDQPQDDE